MSHPFACRKPTCPKCCTKFPQSSKQQDTVASKPIATTSPSMTPPNPRGDATVAFHPSNSTHPVVTQGNRMHTASIIYNQNVGQCVETLSPCTKVKLLYPALGSDSKHISIIHFQLIHLFGPVANSVQLFRKFLRSNNFNLRRVLNFQVQCKIMGWIWLILLLQPTTGGRWRCFGLIFWGSCVIHLYMLANPFTGSRSSFLLFS